MFNLFCSCAEKNCGKLAIIFRNQKITFGQLKSDVCDLRLKLRKQGIFGNKTVGIYMEKGSEYVKTVLALLGCGVSIVPLSIYYTEEEISCICLNAQIDYIITSSILNMNCSVLQYTDILNEMLDEEHDFYGNPTLLLLTSGSTGEPKVSIIPEEILFNRTKAEINQFNILQNDVFCINTPLYHCVGFRMMVTAMTNGLTIILNDIFVPGQWLEMVRLFKPTYTILSPNQIVDLVNYAENKKIQIKDFMFTLRTIISTGAKLRREVKEAFLNLIDCDLYDVIGSSETEFIAINKCQLNQKDELIGKPFKDVEIKILPYDGCQDGTGEVLCKSDMLFAGYFGNDEKTEMALCNGFFRTGDRGYIDEGELYLTGRIKKVIICSGVNIYPEDIEKIIMEDDRISDCYVFGVEDDRCGEVVAVIVAGHEITKDDIRRKCIEKLAIFQLPRLVYIIEKIPRNDMGKVPIDIIKKLISKGDT